MNKKRGSSLMPSDAGTANTELRTPHAANSGHDNVRSGAPSVAPRKKTKRRKKRKKVPTPEELAAVKQQAAIMRKYLRAKRRWDEAFSQVAEELNATWRDVLTRSYAPWDSQWKVWLAVYSPDELEQAIYIAGSKYKAGDFSPHQALAVQELLPYVSGILKRRRERHLGGMCPSCGNPV